MSWVRVWVHVVFTTKNREPVLKKEIRELLFDHIKENAKKKDIWIEALNGFTDHLHVLISLNKDQTISQVLKLIKGESSFWINKNKIVLGKFTWQDDYWAVSVSEGHIAAIKEYIVRQEEHHRKKSFTEEVDEFMKKYGWQFVSG
jgi:REP element-mobilizing transposase RayT